MRWSLLLFLLFSFSSLAESYTCLIGGWPATRNSSGGCDPAQGNRFYSQVSDCDSGQMMCNPAVFGARACVPIDTAQARNSSFANCRRLTAESEEQVDVNLNPELFWDSAEAISQICNEGKGRQAHTAMCRALKIHMSPAVADLEPLPAVSDSKDISNLNSNLQHLTNILESDLKQFEDNCPVQNEEDLRAVLLCQSLSHRIADGANRIERVADKIESADDQSLGCNEAQSLLDEELQAAVDCQAKKENDNFGRELMCAATNALSFDLGFFQIGTQPKAIQERCQNSPEAGCLQQMIVGFFKSIVSAISGIWDLLKMGAKWVGQQASHFWSWIRGVEDTSADKQTTLGELDDEEMGKAKRNLGDWAREKFNAVSEMFKEFVTHDLMCAEWSNPATMSGECLQPADWNCLTSADKISAFCSGMGYLGGEIVGIAFAAGAVSKGVSAGARAISASLRASGQYAKMTSRFAHLGRASRATRVAGGARAAASAAAAAARTTAARTLRHVAQIKQTPAFQAASAMARAAAQSAPVSLASRAARTATQPVRQLARFEARVFQAGQRTTESLLRGRAAVAPTVTSARTGRVMVSPDASNRQRTAYAQQKLNRQLTPQQADAVIEAHRVGAGQIGRDGVNLAGLENYTKTQLLQKRRILEEAGFNSQEIRILMENGIVGQGTGASAYARIQKAIKDNDSTSVSTLTKRLKSENGNRINQAIRDYRRGGNSTDLFALQEDLVNQYRFLQSQGGDFASASSEIEALIKTMDRTVVNRLKVEGYSAVNFDQLTPPTATTSTARSSASSPSSQTSRAINRDEMKRIYRESNSFADFDERVISRRADNGQITWGNIQDEMSSNINKIKGQIQQIDQALDSSDLGDMAIRFRSRKTELETTLAKKENLRKHASKVVKKHSTNFNDVMARQISSEQEWRNIYRDLTPDNARMYKNSNASQVNDLIERGQHTLNRAKAGSISMSPADIKGLEDKLSLLRLEYERINNLAP